MKRVAVVLHGRTAPAWYARVLDELARAGSVEPVAVLRSGGRGRHLLVLARFVLPNLLRLRAGFPLKTWLKFRLKRLLRRPYDVDPWAPHSLRPSLRELPVLRLGSRGDRLVFSEQARRRLRELKVDLVVQDAPWRWRDEDLKLLGDGVVSPSSENPPPPVLRQRFAGAVETLRGEATVTNRLRLQTAAGERELLATQMRMKGNLFHTSQYVPWKLYFLLRHWLRAGMSLEGEVVGDPGEALSARRLREEIRARGRRLADAARRGPRPFQQPWNVALTRAPIPLTGEHHVPDRVDLPMPAGEWWADPFLWRRGGVTALFVEAYDVETRRGYLAAGVVGDDLTVREMRPVLREPFHLSYPCLFEHGCELYMMPEAFEARKLLLYRCVSFPHEWVRDRVLMENVTAIDPTMYRDGERWWLFFTLMEGGATPDDELFLFSAPSPFGPWVPHPMNPVAIGFAHARMAGNLFVRDGRLYRPAQDCRAAYGSALAIQRVETLNPREYRETPVARLLPEEEKKENGLHTLNRFFTLTALDFRRRVEL